MEVLFIILKIIMWIAIAFCAIMVGVCVLLIAAGKYDKGYTDGYEKAVDDITKTHFYIDDDGMKHNIELVEKGEEDG